MTLAWILSDGVPHLIDLRCATDDVFLFRRSAIEAVKLLDSLVAELVEMGLSLNFHTAVISTYLN